MHSATDSAKDFLRPDEAVDSRTVRIRAILDSPAGAAIIAVALLVPSLVWMFRDLRVWSWDPAYYGELVLKIGDAWHDGPLKWLSAFMTVPDSRAPLLPWLAEATVPLIDVFGAERALLLTNFAAGLVSLCLLYSATRRFGGSGALGALGMLAYAGTPGFVAFNHLFLVEAVQAMTIMGLAWNALHADRQSWPRLAAGAVFWLSLALLAKTTSAAYAVPFLLYIGIARAGSQQSRPAAKPIDFFLLFGAVLVAGVTLRWYVLHWPAVAAHIREATSGDVALFYGSDRPFVEKLQHWALGLLQVLSPFQWLAAFILFVGIFALPIALVHIVRDRFADLLRRAVGSHLVFAACLLATIMAGLVGYSKAIGEDIRFLAPMVPLVVLLFAWGLVTLRNRWLSIAALVVLSINWAAVHAVAQHLVVPPQGSFAYLVAPLTDPATMERLTRAVREGCERADGVTIIGAELVNFSGGSASFYAERMRPEIGYRCRYMSLGYLEGDPTRAMKTVEDSRADFFITVPLRDLPTLGTNRLDRVSRTVAEWIATSPDFQRVTPEGDVIVIYRRQR
jgi:Dolichyl-phosphate-mannose-protein mannosyltransferase